MELQDLEFLRMTFTVAKRARDKGNHPFGALLVDETGRVLLDAENDVVTSNDCTGHAETNLIRAASKIYDQEFLATCTLYASTEPCPMCAGAIYWGNIRRVVFGLSEEGLYGLADQGNENALMLSCQKLFQHGRKRIEVIGPLLEEEAREVHLGFWS